MKQIILLLPMLLFSGLLWGKANPYKCVKDKDCVLTYHGCGRYESVNRKYSKRVDKMTRLQDKKKFCNKPTEEEVAFFQTAISVCEKKECKLIPPKSS